MLAVCFIINGQQYTQRHVFYDAVGTKQSGLYGRAAQEHVMQLSVNVCLFTREQVTLCCIHAQDVSYKKT